MSKHTPGPWDFGLVDSPLEGGHIAIGPEYDFEKDDDDETRANGCCNIANCYGPDKFANARLIIQAPNMLSTLKSLLQHCPPTNRKGAAAHARARAIISCAEENA